MISMIVSISGYLVCRKQLLMKVSQDFRLLVSSGDVRNAGILSIVDLSLPSSKKRLFVIDLNAYKLMFNTYVSHAEIPARKWPPSFRTGPVVVKAVWVSMLREILISDIMVIRSGLMAKKKVSMIMPVRGVL